MCLCASVCFVMGLLACVCALACLRACQFVCELVCLNVCLLDCLCVKVCLFACVGIRRLASSWCLSLSFGDCLLELFEMRVSVCL